MVGRPAIDALHGNNDPAVTTETIGTIDEAAEEISGAKE
jgi:hypothetical protein